jgi:hypothetical protein
MKTNIIVNLQVEALHNWPDARNIFPEVGFLSYPHRHIFHIQCKKQVNHDDRDIEIILFKRSILEYLTEKYDNHNVESYHYHSLDFGSRSCEMLAKELVIKFQLDYCQVLEDGENGAEVIV